MAHHGPGRPGQGPDMQMRTLLLWVCLRKQQIRPDDERQSKQRHEPKHGMPAQCNVDPTTDDRRHCRGEGKQHGHEAQELLSLRTFKEIADDGAPDNHADTGADSLQRTEYQQRGEVRCERAADGSQRVDTQSRENHRPASHGIGHGPLYQ